MNDEQLLRYSRQIMLPGVDLDGQEMLSVARVTLVGAGGLGNAVALYLAAAGVGHLRLIDDDVIETSNLARQIAYTDADVGQFKVEVLKRETLLRNPTAQVEAVRDRLTQDNAKQLLLGSHVVVDCSDNYNARFAINDTSFAMKIPVVYGAATAWQGQVFVCDPGNAQSPCYECFNPSRSELDTSCARNGVLGPLLGVMASQQAVEAMRLILGLESSSVLQLYDARDSHWHRILLKPRKGCQCCGGS